MANDGKNLNKSHDIPKLRRQKFAHEVVCYSAIKLQIEFIGGTKIVSIPSPTPGELAWLDEFLDVNGPFYKNTMKDLSENVLFKSNIDEEKFKKYADSAATYGLRYIYNEEKFKRSLGLFVLLGVFAVGKGFKNGLLLASEYISEITRDLLTTDEQTFPKLNIK